MRRSASLFLSLVLAAGALAACGDDDDGGTAGPPAPVTVTPAGEDPNIPGVKLYEIGDYTHVKVGDPIVYVDQPPVGGTHWFAPGWAECGFYDEVIPEEAGVHDLEHGAVWVTYRPDLAAADVAVLQGLARTDGHLLVTPFEGLRAPLVATAWGAQLDLDQAGDGRLVQFIAAYTNGERAPEAGATCGTGDGVDADPIDLG
jgi:hypothetical protein